MMNRRRFLTVSACTLAGPVSAGSPFEWRGYGLGSDLSIKLWTDQKTADIAFLRIQSIIQQVEAAFSIYDPLSELSRLNLQKSIIASDMFLDLAACVDEVHNLTNGYFDPSVQALWNDVDAVPKSWTSIQRIKKAFEIGPEQFLTFNGIAQGYAAELAKSELRSMGLSRVLVNLGEFASIGGPFKIGISDPDVDLIDVVSIQNAAIATSSPWAMQTKLGGHILNPVNTNRPRFTTLSVVHQSATFADGLSTGLVFADDAEIKKCLSDKNGPTCVVGRRDNGEVVKFT